MVPTEPLAGIEKPLPRRMTSPSEVALQAVGRGQDPDVVAAQAQVLVQVADVLGHAARQRVDVRRDEADLHRAVSLGVGRLEPRRPVVPARVAVVAPGPVAPQPPADLGPRVAAVLAQLPPERPELARRAVEAAVVASWCRPGSRRGGRRRSSPGSVVQPEPIAASAWASLLPIWDSPWSAANRTTRSCQYRPRAVGLNVSIASGPDRRVAGVEQPAEHEPLGAQRVRDEGMGGDRDPALLVDGGDRPAQALAAPARAARGTARAGGRRGC